MLEKVIAVSKDKSSKQIDADILQCKADILRARDIMPPYDQKGCESPGSQHTDKNANQSATAVETLTTNPRNVREDAIPIPIETTKHKVATPPTVTTVNHKPAVTNQCKEHEIPEFDLAEEIMAEQRRITAVKRKAPAKKIEAVSPPSTTSPAGSAGLSQWPRPLAQEQIIAEIVARDIEKLCRGDMLDVRQQDFENIAKGAEQNTPPRP